MKKALTVKRTLILLGLILALLLTFFLFERKASVQKRMTECERLYRQSEEYKETWADLAKWNISEATTLNELQDYTIGYLVSVGENVTPGTDAFDAYVRKIFVGDAFPVAQMARENPAFGKAYVYLSFYKTNILDRESEGDFAVASVKRQSDNRLVFSEEALKSTIYSFLLELYCAQQPREAG